MNQRSGRAAKSEKRKAKSEKRKAKSEKRKAKSEKRKAKSEKRKAKSEKRKAKSRSLGFARDDTVTSARLSYERGGSVGSALDQLKRTYWKSRGLPFTPFTGGAIQLANLPSSATRPLIRDWT